MEVYRDRSSRESWACVMWTNSSNIVTTEVVNGQQYNKRFPYIGLM